MKKREKEMAQRQREIRQAKDKLDQLETRLIREKTRQIEDEGQRETRQVRGELEQIRRKAETPESEKKNKLDAFEIWSLLIFFFIVVVASYSFGFVNVLLWLVVIFIVLWVDGGDGHLLNAIFSILRK